MDLVIKNGECALRTGTGYKIEKVEIGIRQGQIQTIGKKVSEKAKQVFDAKGLTILPGVIDTQVHFREPGLTHKEDLASGTRSAILGGVTTVFEMPNTKPPTVSALDLADKLERAKGRAWCDHAFFIGASHQNIDRLAELESLPGCCGVKVFVGSSTGDLLVESDELIKRVLKNGQRRVAFHCEDEFRLRERKSLLTQIPNVFMHPLWRDDATALIATQRVVRLALQAQRPIHILHVTTAQEIDFLREHKKLVTVEVTPQHLTLYAPECYEQLGTLAQMNPPIRDKQHYDNLWKGIEDGTVDVIGTDHAPHTREEKAQTYPQTPSGMPGVQTLVPVMLNHVHQGRLSLARLIDLICYNPARIYNIKNRGAIQVDFDATFTVIDRKRQETINNQWIASKCGWTPFDGMKVTGWPVATLIRGQVVMRDNEVIGSPTGLPVEFEKH